MTDYTHLEMEAALCVWEEINERTLGDKAASYPALCAHREAVGSVELRHKSIELGQFCLKVYDLIPEHAKDGNAYDWEVIPAILDTMEPGEPGEPWPVLLDPGVAARVAASKLLPLERWKQEANFALERKYGLTLEDAGIDETHVRAIFDNGWASPEGWVEEYAKKNDLELVQAQKITLKNARSQKAFTARALVEVQALMVGVRDGTVSRDQIGRTLDDVERLLSGQEPIPF